MKAAHQSIKKNQVKKEKKRYIERNKKNKKTKRQLGLGFRSMGGVVPCVASPDLTLKAF